MANPLARKAMAQSVTNASLAASGWNQVYGEGGSAPRAAAPPPVHQRDLNVRLICKQCQIDPPNIVEETANGDLVCADCGLVLGDRLVDTRSEWRTFANDEGPDQSRVGAGPSHNQALEGIEDFTTEINFRDGQTGIARALQKTQRAVLGSSAAGRRDSGFEKIEEYCGKMQLSSRIIVDTAKQIFLRVEEVRADEGNKHKFARGPKGADAVAGTCIYLACKENRLSRTMKEVCDVCQIKKKDLGYSIKAISEQWRGDLLSGHRHTVISKTALPSQAAADLLPRFCSRLGLTPKDDGNAKEVIEKAFSGTSGIVDGRSPISVAAGAIWFVVTLFDLGPTLRQISEVAQVSEGTIKLVAKIFMRNSDELVSSRWLQEGADVARIAMPTLGLK